MFVTGLSETLTSRCRQVPACTRHLKTYPGSWHVISCAMLLTMATESKCRAVDT